MCSHSKRRDYFYSVYTNRRICRHCWTEAEEEQMAANQQAEEALGSLLRTMAKAVEDNAEVEMTPFLPIFQTDQEAA